MTSKTQWIVAGVVILAVFLRLVSYGDLHLSIPIADTASYMKSSRVDLLSWQAFTSYRPYTTNLVYGLFATFDESDYPEERSMDTTRRKSDAVFSRVAMLQTAVSVLAWSCLAWSVSSRLRNAFLKVAAAVMIFTFAFTPQVADWDSVMSAESLSISLFILALALLIPLAFRHQENQEPGISSIGLMAAFFIVLFLWVFVRDVNAYSLVSLIFLTFGVSLLQMPRRTKLPVVVGGVAILLLIVGVSSARQRPLWHKALTHVWEADILPVASHVKYFTARGMPDPLTPEYGEWFDQHAPTAYMRFLLAHPVYTTHKFLWDMDRAFSENLQPYFHAKELPSRPLLILAGNYLHPRSGTIFFVTAILLMILVAHAISQGSIHAAHWAWLMTWAFLTAGVTLFFTIFGDTNGLIRHALSSATTYRLLMWLLLFLVADLMIGLRQRNDSSDHGPALD